MNAPSHHDENTQGRTARPKQKSALAFGRISLTVLLFIAVSASAIQQLAQFTCARSAAMPLQSSIKVAQGVKSFGFCSAVGGVAFGSLATPAEGIVVEDLRYAAGRADGSRIVATVRNGNETQAVVVPVYDWQAVPTAKFADGEQDALFTYFGRLVDKEEQKTRVAKGEKILNYHPAIFDTLVGIRMMQADLLAFHAAATGNFTDNGIPVKGPGEQLRDVQDNVRDARIIHSIYASGKARSYVICDVGVDIRFSVADVKGRNELSFTGYPLWSCWRLTKDIREIQNEYNTQHNQMLKQKFDEYVKNHPNTTQADVDAYMQALHNANDINTFVDRNYFEVLPRMTEDLSTKMAELEGGNPVVYRALRKLMHGAAFFRHVKANKPAVYADFMKSIENVQPEPRIETPTVLIPPAG